MEMLRRLFRVETPLLLIHRLDTRVYCIVVDIAIIHHVLVFWKLVLLPSLYDLLVVIILTENRKVGCVIELSSGELPCSGKDEKKNS
jgi:hypothetical protein